MSCPLALKTSIRDNRGGVVFCFAEPLISDFELIVKPRSRINLLLLIFIFFRPEISAAEKSLERSVESQSWPPVLSVRAGQLRIQILGERFWTLSGIEFQGRTMAVESSAFGTAINFRGDGFLGSAHKLDVPGRIGEVEEERVTDLQIEVDQSNLSFPVTEQEIQCREFQLRRTSSIRSFTLNSELRLQDGRIDETVTITAGKAADLKIMYPLMYAWSSSMKFWLMSDSEGILREGAFSEAEQGDSSVVYQQMAKWLAVYDPESKTGAVTVVSPVSVSRSTDVAEAFLPEEYAVQIVDAPNVYRKLYLVSFSDRTVPEGFRGTYRMKTAFMTAEQGEWQTAAKQIAEQIQKQKD